MTDNEIVKALECCSNCVCNNDKDECPLLKMSFCKNYLMKQSLDLINRQKAEIEMNDAEIKELRIALQGYLDDVAKTRNLYKQSIEELNQANAEIERLKQIVGFTPARGSRKSPLLNAVLDNVRAEAYRECIEKINKNLNSRASFGSMDESVICESIILENDDLLKELVGEDDG